MAELNQNNGKLLEFLVEQSDKLCDDGKPVAIILAAGHGKRIKSERSKMLHEIWGVPTVVRVARAASLGLDSANQIIVVGIKAHEVVAKMGKQAQRVFVYQKEQKGTGDAVRTALSVLRNYQNVKSLVVFPGDMGLITPEVVADFYRYFQSSGCCLTILTGIFHGPVNENSYGRILRVPSRRADGSLSGADEGKVIEIKEHKDILALPDDRPYEVPFRDHKYVFSKKELLEIKEYNAGVYAIQYEPFAQLIDKISPNNVQGEFYLTDIIAIFNQNDIAVEAFSVQDETAVIGFNVKSILRQMEQIARRKVWEQLRDIIYIEDEDDFFIAEEVVQQILEMDKTCPALDIQIGKGAYISKGVQLSRGVIIKTNCYLAGNIEIGENTTIQENVSLSTYSGQKMVIGKNCIIMRGDLIKGNIRIGDNTRIESGVIITGSDEFPTLIGKNVTIKGTTYIFGSIIEDDLFIEHSVIKCKRVERTVRKDGSIQPVRWIMPPPQGLDIIRELDE